MAIYLLCDVSDVFYICVQREHHNYKNDSKFAGYMIYIYMLRIWSALKNARPALKWRYRNSGHTRMRAMPDSEANIYIIIIIILLQLMKLTSK
jgi:hypothetical protein